jgi:hypothetical protein
MKAMWDIIKTVTGKKVNNEDICLSNHNGNVVDNYQVIPSGFNHYFLSVAKGTDKIKHNYKINSNDNRNHRHYMLQSFSNTFPNIKFSNTSAKETERIIKSLKSRNSHGYDEI